MRGCTGGCQARIEGAPLRPRAISRPSKPTHTTVSSATSTRTLEPVCVAAAAVRPGDAHSRARAGCASSAAHAGSSGGGGWCTDAYVPALDQNASRSSTCASGASQVERWPAERMAAHRLVMAVVMAATAAANRACRTRRREPAWRSRAAAAACLARHARPRRHLPAAAPAGRVAPAPALARPYAAS